MDVRIKHLLERITVIDWRNPNSNFINERFVQSLIITIRIAISEKVFRPNVFGVPSRQKIQKKRSEKPNTGTIDPEKQAINVQIYGRCTQNTIPTESNVVGGNCYQYTNGSVP